MDHFSGLVERLDSRLDREVKRAVRPDRDLRALPPFMADCNFQFNRLTKEKMSRANFLRILGNKVHTVEQALHLGQTKIVDACPAYRLLFEGTRYNVNVISELLANPCDCLPKRGFLNVADVDAFLDRARRNQSHLPQP